MLLFVFAVVYYFFIDNNKEISSCISCHDGIETVSSSHLDLSCTDCHGGSSLTMDKDNAHKNMYGRNNPSDPSVWMQTCGRCHEYEVKRVSSSLMLTNTGIIKNTLAAWGEENGRLYSQNNNDKTYDKHGNIITIDNISEYDTISADMLVRQQIWGIKEFIHQAAPHAIFLMGILENILEMINQCREKAYILLLMK